MHLASEAAAKRVPGPPAWVLAAGVRSEATQFSGRSEVDPRAGRDCAADVYRQAGVTDPRRQIDVAEIYVPFSWFEPMWLQNLGFPPDGQGGRRTVEGPTATAADPPLNPPRPAPPTHPLA